jgi:hypothetical protein
VFTIPIQLFTMAEMRISPSRIPHAIAEPADRRYMPTTALCFLVRERQAEGNLPFVESIVERVFRDANVGS